MIRPRPCPSSARHHSSDSHGRQHTIGFLYLCRRPRPNLSPRRTGSRGRLGGHHLFRWYYLLFQSLVPWPVSSRRSRRNLSLSRGPVMVRLRRLWVILWCFWAAATAPTRRTFQALALRSARSSTLRRCPRAAPRNTSIVIGPARWPSFPRDRQQPARRGRYHP